MIKYDDLSTLPVIVLGAELAGVRSDRLVTDIAWHMRHI